MVKDFRNELLKRREVKFIVEHSGNPGFEGAKKMVAEQFKAAEETIVVRGVNGKFGRGTFLIDSFIYDTAEDMNKIEPKPKVKKEGKK